MTDSLKKALTGSALISILLFSAVLFAVSSLEFYYVLRNTANHSTLSRMADLPLPAPPSEAKLERIASESHSALKRQSKEAARFNFISKLADKSKARQYFQYARYATREHDKKELTAGLIVGLIFAFIFGNGPWLNTLGIGCLAFGATLLTIFLLNWIRAPSAFHEHWESKVKHLPDTDTRRLKHFHAERLSALLREAGEADPVSRSPTLGTFAGIENHMLRFSAQHTRALHFLRAHYPKEVGRFEKDGNRVLEELLAEALQDEDPTRPLINGEIEEVYMESVIEIPEKAENRRFDCFVTIKAHVFNARPNIPASAKFQLEVETSKGRFRASQSDVGDQRLKVSRKDTDQVPQMSKVVSVIVNIEEQELVKVGSRLTLNPGKEGWLRFIVPEEDAPRDEIEVISLLAIDDYGTPHRIPSSKSEWAQSGELLRQRDIDFEEELQRMKNKRLSDKAYGG